MRILFTVAALAVGLVAMAALAPPASAQGFGVHIIGGVTIGDDQQDRRVDNPGFNVGAGLDWGASQNFVLRGSFIYTDFPFWSAEEQADSSQFASDGGQTNYEIELVLRLSPKGTTPPGAPVLYFLLGTGTGLMKRDPIPQDGDEQIEYTFGMVGIGFESKIRSGRMRLWVELVAKATSHEVGTYYPIRMGFRF